MEREAAEKRIQELRDLVRYHSRLYYELDNPELDDYEYDLLYHELLDTFLLLYRNEWMNIQ